jgi:hypothetical protein
LVAIAVGQRGLDAACERVDEVRELGDRFKCSVLAPAGDVGNGFAGGVESCGAENDQRGGVDDDFCLCPGVPLVVDAEGVDGLVARVRTRAFAGASASTTIRF